MAGIRRLTGNRQTENSRQQILEGKTSQAHRPEWPWAFINPEEATEKHRTAHYGATDKNQLLTHGLDIDIPGTRSRFCEKRPR